MKTKPLSIEDLRDLIKKGESRDPLVFLESVMNGHDPRKLSSIYKLVCEIDEFTGGDLDKNDWSEIVDRVIADYKYDNVLLSESLAASKTLAEYLYPKRKQVDINGIGETEYVLNALTEEEIELFKEKFNDDF